MYIQHFCTFIHVNLLFEFFSHSARTRSCAHDGCNPSNCHESTHKHRIPNANKPSFGNTLSPDDHNDIVTAFSESCRLDNLAPEFNSTQVQQQQQQQQQSPIGNPHQHNMYHGVGPSASTIHTSQSPQSHQPVRPILHYTHSNMASSPTTSTSSNQTTMLEKRNDVNLHQKLQRQLSLNPNAYDPRLIRMHNANSLQSKHSHPEQMQAESSQTMQPHTGQHRQLAPSHSGPRTHMTKHWDLHQVGRHHSDSDLFFDSFFFCWINLFFTNSKTIFSYRM